MYTQTMHRSERLPSFLLAQSSNNAQSLYQGNQTQQHSPCLPTLHAILANKKMQLIKQIINLKKNTKLELQQSTL